MLDYQAAVRRASDKEGRGAAVDSLSPGNGNDIRQLLAVLPYSEHCLLPFCAYGGHVELVKALLPLTQAVLSVHSAVHYVKTSAFFAAAAGGRDDVLSELLAAGALHWACQLPGTSLTKTAMDLAAQGGHLKAMQVLSKHVGRLTSNFLLAAVDSGSEAVMEWALGFWFRQFNALVPFGTAHVQQLHDALRVACHKGHLVAIRQLLCHLNAVRCHDCCVLALSYTASSSNTEAMRAVLESPYLPQQLIRGGPKLLQQLVMAVASCLRIAIRINNRPSLELLLRRLSSSSSPLAAVRPLLGLQMPSVLEQAASAGNSTALQLVLVQLPEYYSSLSLSALEAALVEGHYDLAATIKMLLVMRGPVEGFEPAAVSSSNNPAVGRAARLGAYKTASSRGDVEALQELLMGGAPAVAAGGVADAVVPAAAGVGPDDNEQLVMLRLAAAAGHEAAVRLLLAEFGDGNSRLELCLATVCRAAVHAGQLQLLQALASDEPSHLLSHLVGQADTLGEYIRTALLCNQIEVAVYLVGVASQQQQQLTLVGSTLQSLLTTSRWELWNIGVGRSAYEAVAALLKALVAQSRTGSMASGPGSGPAAEDPADADVAAPAAAGASHEIMVEQVQPDGGASCPDGSTGVAGHGSGGSWPPDNHQCHHPSAMAGGCCQDTAALNGNSVAIAIKPSSTCEMRDELLLDLSCSATGDPPSPAGSACCLPGGGAASPPRYPTLFDGPAPSSKSLPINVSGSGDPSSHSHSSHTGTDDGGAALACSGHSSCSRGTDSHSHSNISIREECWPAGCFSPGGPLLHSSFPLAGQHTPGWAGGQQLQSAGQQQAGSNVRQLLCQVEQLSMSPPNNQQHKQQEQQAQGCARHLLRMSHPAEGAAGPHQAPTPLRNALSLPSPTRQPLHPFLHNYHLLRQQQLQQQQQQ
eukprot:gene8891-9069_t